MESISPKSANSHISQSTSPKSAANSPNSRSVFAFLDSPSFAASFAKPSNFSFLESPSFAVDVSPPSPPPPSFLSYFYTNASPPYLHTGPPPHLHTGPPHFHTNAPGVPPRRAVPVLPDDLVLKCVENPEGLWKQAQTVEGSKTLCLLFKRIRDNGDIQSLFLTAMLICVADWVEWMQHERVAHVVTACFNHFKCVIPLHEVVKDEFEPLACHHVGYRVVLESLLSSKEEDVLLEMIISRAVELAQCGPGSKILERVTLNNATVQVGVVKVLMGQFIFLSKHKNGNFVVQKLLTSAPAESRLQIIREIFPDKVNMVSDHYGRYVIRTTKRVKPGLWATLN